MLRNAVNAYQSKDFDVAYLVIGGDFIYVKSNVTSYGGIYRGSIYLLYVAIYRFFCYNRRHFGIWKASWGSREPDLDTLVKIAKYFNVSIGYLLGNDFI